MYRTAKKFLRDCIMMKKQLIRENKFVYFIMPKKKIVRINKTNKKNINQFLNNIINLIQLQSN
jgi:hypothetical protein